MCTIVFSFLAMTCFETKTGAMFGLGVGTLNNALVDQQITRGD